MKPAKRSSFCSGCGCRAPRCDHRKRDWRHLDICGLSVSLEHEAWRVDCARCAVTTEMVPWAAAGSGFTHAFEEVVAYLAQRTDRTTVSAMMEIAWKTVGLNVSRRNISYVDVPESAARSAMLGLGLSERHEPRCRVKGEPGASAFWSLDAGAAVTSFATAVTSYFPPSAARDETKRSRMCYALDSA